jgi:hypothetical protein
METDELERKLLSYIQASNHAQAVLSQYRGITISGGEIQSALCEKLGIEDENTVDLIHKGLTGEAIVEHLRAFDFKRYHPEILGEIELDESILPEGTVLLLTEQTIKVKGEIWQVHKNDDDPFPSIPHAHNYASGLSLNLGTGELFKKREKVNQLQCKKLLAIREKLTAFDLPDLDERCK